jgi:hypothetical protein
MANQEDVSGILSLAPELREGMEAHEGKSYPDECWT